MLYIYPFMTFGSVALNHYNLWADRARADGSPIKNQNSAFGMGIGLGYRVQYLELGIGFSTLYTSATSNWREGSSNAYTDYTLRHSLLSFLIYLPIGLNYPLTEQFSVYFGVKPIMGFSNLSWYDSAYVYLLGLSSYGVRDASLGKSSFGLGFDFGGDFGFSRSLALYVRFGYDVINFKGYEGEYEKRLSDGTRTKKLAYLVFDTDNNTLSVKDRPYDPSKGEIPGEENLSGFRFSLGIKVGIGR
ncbi:MAG: outer membrane beta-barrel protein [candidate division WOR-3 bacterium]